VARAYPDTAPATPEGPERGSVTGSSFAGHKAVEIYHASLSSDVLRVTDPRSGAVSGYAPGGEWRVTRWGGTVRRDAWGARCSMLDVAAPLAT